MDVIFPLEASVLSSHALGTYMTGQYFPGATLTCRLFYRSLHDTYKVVTDHKEYFFKVYRQGIRSREEIQTEIDLLHHLKSSGIETVIPVAKWDGTYISDFHTGNGMRYGVLYTSVGKYEFTHLEETVEVNERLGKYIASIHRAWDDFEFGINRWRLDAHSFIDRSMNAIREFSTVHEFDVHFLEEVAKGVKKKLESLSTERPQYGVCHGDIYSGNIRVDDNHQPILIDFDFCGIGWRAYDISMYAFPFGMGSDVTKLKEREQRKNQFLNGYNKVRAMSGNEVDSIALFIPFRRIFNIGTLYISYFPTTWGDYAVLRNVDDDIALLKKWLEINPVL
ncbi:phosphotransferase enzyme family protein [Gorillibacterium timonense]|uniref:phosphotransferase enzyme family protein n=1 Tax=Gorillibacterium timonense TaxID=1689269 RepID=UPI00071E6846|nr:phosphotransferase [Gorillibacterium timonense]